MEYGYISPRRLSCWLHSGSSLVAEKRLTGEGSIYQRSSDGRWVGVVDLGWVGGKRVRKTVTAKTLKELRPKFKALNKTIESGVMPDEGTVEQWMTEYLREYVDRKLRPSTAATYRRYVDKWVIPNIGKRRLDRLRPEHLEAIYNQMEDADKSDATRRQVHAILHRALKLAVRRNLIATNPADRLDPPAVGKGSHGKLTLPEAKKVIRSLGKDPNPSRWACALLAGLRQGEALGLTWDRVDFDRNVIIVEQAIQQVPGQGLQVVDLKSRSSYRAVPMIAAVRGLLLAERQTSGYVWGGDKPIGPRADWQEWSDMLNRAGVRHVPLHAARATCGSLLQEAKVPDKIIAEILGHSQVSVTQKHYLHGDELQHISAMEALGELVAE